MAGTEEEAAENLQEAMNMETEEEGGNVVEVDEGGGGNQRALVALYFLTQNADPSGTTLVDSRNGFSELSRLEMLWTVQHRWPAGASFVFNLYRHWEKLLLCQTGELPVTLMSR